jgi:hypothetical protein
MPSQAPKRAATTGEPGKGHEFCYLHDPVRRQERSKNASTAARARYGRVKRELQLLKDVLKELIEEATSNSLSHDFVRLSLPVITSLAQAFVRATLVQISMVTENLDDINVPNTKSLKREVMKRIEALEQAQRERDESLEEIKRLMQESGLALPAEVVASLEVS